MAVTLQRARQLFNLVNSRLCCPASAPAPCIPFMYPDDGCWGRAHEMCRLMIEDGAQPIKVWIYGSLRVDTNNKPSCAVRWGWHVAPTLRVSTSSGTKTFVIDPSLFNGPVTQATWVNVQGDPSATTIASNASVYYRNQSGTWVEDDPTYSKTQNVLTTYRNRLKLRSAGADGPPPYFACSAKPSGVQWRGTIGRHQVRRWFTYNWPASWHVFWTIMSLTPCPKGPQLTWTVEVERASAQYCTYWITVRNMTSDPVKFEGRYDILKR